MAQTKNGTRSVPTVVRFPKRAMVDLISVFPSFPKRAMVDLISVFPSFPKRAMVDLVSVFQSVAIRALWLFWPDPWLVVPTEYLYQAVVPPHAKA